MSFSAAPARTRRAAFLLTLLTAALLLTDYVAAPPAYAQEGTPPAGGGQATPAPAQQAGALDDFFGMIAHIFRSVGLFFGFILLVVSICLVALIVLLAMDLRMSGAIPPGFVEEFTDTVNKRQFKAAYEMAKGDSSFLGRVMTAGMARLQYGIDDAREAAFNMVESIKAGKDTLVAYLATIGTLGPLLGLIGTVWGMIGAFRTLHSGENFQALAGFIAQALVLTLLGISLSVPAIFTHTFFRNRLTRISLDTANIADDLLTQMYHNSKKPAPVAAPAAALDAADARGPVRQK
jgi:biopolymer transport protein ExbB